MTLSSFTDVICDRKITTIQPLLKLCSTNRALQKGWLELIRVEETQLPAIFIVRVLVLGDDFRLYYANAANIGTLRVNSAQCMRARVDKAKLLAGRHHCAIVNGEQDSRSCKRRNKRRAVHPQPHILCYTAR